MSRKLEGGFFDSPTAIDLLNSLMSALSQEEPSVVLLPLGPAKRPGEKRSDLIPVQIYQADFPTENGNRFKGVVAAGEFKGRIVVVGISDGFGVFAESRS